MADVPLFILYGSATGNAESIAKDLAKKYKNNLPSPFNKLVCLQANDFKKKCLPIWEKEPLQELSRKYGLVLVISTTGNGDCPENGGRFLRYLKRKTTIESAPLKHIAYAVLGLGDTNYDQFCESGKIADKKLSECGAERVKKLGMADEGTGMMEDIVDAWVEDVVPLLAKSCESKTVDASSSKSHREEKKTEESTAPASVTSFGSRPNVQALLNRRLGVPVRPAAAPINTGSRPSIPPVAKSESIIKAVELEKTALSVDEEHKNTSSDDVRSPSPLFILYGSATGNAEHIAKDLASKYEKMLAESKEDCYFPGVLCCELDQYKKKCLKIWEDDSDLNCAVRQKHGVIIISSTTGNGDAPENASRFVRYIKRKSTVDSMPFKNVAFSVLGLGDTNYDQFCETGKIIDKKVKDLGGIRVQDVACADEGTGLEQVVDPWVETIFKAMTNGCKRSTSNDEGKDDGDLPSQSLEKTIVTTEDKDPASFDQKIGDMQFKTSDLGVSILRSLLNVDTIPDVDSSLKPTLGTSFSSCQLFNEEEELENRKNSRGLSLSELEKMTISSGSSNIHYTINDPFESQILSARYLTATDQNGAKSACNTLDITKSGDGRSQDDKMIDALKQIRDTFPLVGEGKKIEQNGKRVIELKLSLPDDFTLEYEPGDAIGVVVSNTFEATAYVLQMLEENHGILGSQKVSLDSKHPITVAKAIKDHIDLCSPIKNKRLLMSLSQFATDKSEADALQLLASKDTRGLDLFQKYIVDQRINVIDVLTQFPSCRCITLEGLLSILPGIPPRYYSISSSPLGQKGALHLTVAFSVVDYMTPRLLLQGNTCLQRRVGGVVTTYLEALCSPFLAGLSDGDIEENFALDCVRIFPKPTSDFRLPSNLTTPMILIGPGTGVAPFIGFLKHRQAQLTSIDSTKIAQEVSEGTWRGGFDFEEEDLPVSKQDAKGLVVGADYRSGQKHGDVAMFFGCRYSDHDYLYQSEMKSLENSGIITNLQVAFSRDSEESKCYVQDKLKKEGKAMINMIINESAAVYICGDGNAMAKDVQQALIGMLAEHQFSGDTDSLQKAKIYLEDMKRRNKMLLDIWS